MKFDDIKHNSTRKAVLRLAIPEDQLDLFETIEMLREYIRSQRTNSWKKNTRYMQERYKTDPEYREKIKLSARNSYYKKHPPIAWVELSKKEESENKKPILRGRGRPRIFLSATSLEESAKQ